MSSISKEIVTFLHHKLSNNSNKTDSRRSSFEQNPDGTSMLASNVLLYEENEQHEKIHGTSARKASSNESKTSRRHSMPETVSHPFGPGAGNLDTIHEVSLSTKLKAQKQKRNHPNNYMRATKFTRNTKLHAMSHVRMEIECVHDVFFVLFFFISNCF